MKDAQEGSAQTSSALPPDDPDRKLTVVAVDASGSHHLGLAGDTYTILLTGEDTGGRYCLIDMYVPPGGGPPPHRHDFEESFTILEGELEATFRGSKVVVKTGETINIPANAPHQFRNATSTRVRMLCICAPAGQENFFLAVGAPVPSRTAPAPAADEKSRAKLAALAPLYRTELLPFA